MLLNPLLYDTDKAEKILEELNNPEFYLKSLDEYQKMQQLIFLNEQLSALLEMEDISLMALMSNT